MTAPALDALLKKESPMTDATTEPRVPTLGERGWMHCEQCGENVLPIPFDVKWMCTDHRCQHIQYDSIPKNWPPIKRLPPLPTEMSNADISVALERANATIAAQAERIAALEQGMAKSNEDVCQTLGKALGYPWFKDDPTNFPGSTEEHGVCVGEHVAESIAAEAARKIAALEAEVARLTSDNEGLTKHLDDCVQERLDEMSVEAADFDKEVWRALCSYLKDRKGFSWHDYQDGIHAEDVIEFLRCCDEAAESSLAETRAKVEGLEKIVEELRPMIDADGKFNILVWAERQPRLLAALSALPEAKPAAQAEGE